MCWSTKSIGVIILLLNIHFSYNLILPYKGYFYDMKPYIYSENGTVKGLAVEAFNELANFGEHCLPPSAGMKIVQFTEQFASRDEFTEQLIRHFNTNTSKNNASMASLWFPILQDFSDNAKNPLFAQNFMKMDLLFAHSVAVIARLEQIDHKHKFFLSMLGMNKILLLIVSASIFYGCITWLFERLKNPEFPHSFLLGSGTGVWLAFVTMSSVGYGDVAPRNFFGRFFGVSWMVLGLLIASTITGIATNIMDNTDYLSLRNQDVAALNNSIEAGIISSSFNSSIRGYSTYQEVVRAVQQDETILGVINTEIASHMQDTWNNGVDDLKAIGVIDKIKMETPVQLGFYHLDSAVPMFICISPFSDIVREVIRYKHERELEVIKLYKPPIGKTLNGVYLYIVIAISGLILLGWVLDLVVLAYRKVRGNKNAIQDDDGRPDKMVNVPEDDLVEMREQINIIQRLVDSTLKT